MIILIVIIIIIVTIIIIIRGRAGQGEEVEAAPGDPVEEALEGPDAVLYSTILCYTLYYTLHTTHYTLYSR